MATYNGEKYIREQLDSIICQLTNEDELIISDDGSTDRTLEIVEQYNDPRLKLVFNPGGRNFTNNFENAIKNSSGDYIFLSDQDDIWLPNKVKVLSEYLLQYKAVFSNGIFVDEHLNVINDSFFKMIDAGRGIIKNIIRGRYYGFGLAFRKELLKYAFPFPTIRGDLVHDSIIGSIADMLDSIIFIDEPFTLYRRHQNTVSGFGIRKRRNILIIIRGRLFQIFALINLYIRIARRK
jgi:glycosyltransferase involved in cell wall biosynthesis